MGIQSETTFKTTEPLKSKRAFLKKNFNDDTKTWIIVKALQILISFNTNPNWLKINIKLISSKKFRL